VRAVQANPEGLHSLFIPTFFALLFHLKTIFVSVFNTFAALGHVRAVSIVLYVMQSSAMLPVLQNA
jgi:hypothetical protein